MGTLPYRVNVQAKGLISERCTLSTGPWAPNGLNEGERLPLRTEGVSSLEQPSLTPLSHFFLQHFFFESTQPSL